MSECQSFEFRAVDRPLDAEAMAAMRRVSSRGRITPTSYSNTYHWGDFKGNVRQWMTDWFDVFVHTANWGTRWVMLRLPAELTTSWGIYGQSGLVSIERRGPHALVEFLLQPDDWGGSHVWYEDEEVAGTIDSLVGLRAELLEGDLRPLYLGWLIAVSLGGADSEAYIENDPDEAELTLGEEVEPPVPAGLATLTAAQQTLADFFALDPDLLAVAAEASPPPATPPTTAELAAWLTGVSAEHKEAWLVEVADGYGSRVRSRLWSEFALGTGRVAPTAPGRRTAAELLKAAEARREARERAAAQAAERARIARERKEAEQRRKYLDTLEGQEDELWRQVRQFAAVTQPKSYDEAIKLLRDLRELAQRHGLLTEWEAQLEDFRAAQGRKPALVRRLNEQGW